MKKVLNCIYIILFVAVCSLPMILWGGLKLSGSEASADIEKSEVREFPALFTDEGRINSSFDDECEAWLNQNIPFRGQLVSGFNVLLSSVMKTPTSNVVTGSDGWIFSSETIDDYMDTNEMSESDLHSIVITMSLIQENVENNGGNFLFVPIPNKNSIYPEYMPARYVKARENNLDRLYEELEDSGVNYLDMKKVLLNAKSDLSPGKIYSKRDTHWTALGAAAGFDSMMEKLDKKTEVWEGQAYTVEYTRHSDLDKLLFPVGNRPDEEYVFERNIDCDSFEFTYPAGTLDTEAQLQDYMSDREDHDNNFSTAKKTESDGSSLFMVRDSFGRALLPYLIDAYDSAVFVRSTAPSFEGVADDSDVIYEIVERNLEDLIGTAPYMFAPERENAGTDTVEFAGVTGSCFCLDEGFAYRIFGAVSPEMCGDDGRIYVRLTGDSEEKTYEAFPIYEENLIAEAMSGEDITGDCDGTDVRGYSLYLDRESLAAGDYDVSIISGNGRWDTDKFITVEGTEDSGTENSEESVESSGEVSADINNNVTNVTEEAGDSEFTDTQNPYGDEAAEHGIIYRDTLIRIGDSMEHLKEPLGNQAAPAETVTSCLSGTDAVMYYYPGITIEVDTKGNIYYISMMDNSYYDGGDAAATKAGVTIGSSAEEVSDKLGSPAVKKDSFCIYDTDNIEITYSFADGMVSSVIFEDRKYINDTGETADEGTDTDAVITDEKFARTGWQILDGDYYFFDRQTGERVLGRTVDGIEIAQDGSVNLSSYDVKKIETMMKAHKFVAENTLPTDTMEEKRKKMFDWVLSFPYHRYRKLKDVYTDEAIEITEANDIFDLGAGDCVSESAAVAFLFHEIGYNSVYWVHDTGHSWVRCGGRLFDPLFAESRDYDANYDAPFTDYRDSMSHSLLIY